MKLEQFDMRFLKTVFLAFCVAIGSASAQADPGDPLALVQNTTALMLEKLDAEKRAIRKNNPRLLEIVEAEIIPHVDTRAIARKVLARHWRKATETQKAAFESAFSEYLVRFYSRAFAAYDGQTIEYLNMPSLEGKRLVTVKTQIIQKNHAPIAVDYKLSSTEERWFVTDIVVENISLVISNRKQYHALIRKSGLDMVIERLQSKNAEPFVIKKN